MDVPATSWHNGNYSCDCNRGREGEPPDFAECCGNERYLVIRAEYEEMDGEYRYTIRGLNEDYPPALLNAWTGLA